MAALMETYRDRLFNSEEVGCLTGVAPEKQRFWRSRGFVSFERDSPPIWDGHLSWIGWPQLMRWALLGTMVRSGIKIKSAVQLLSLIAFDDKGEPIGCLSQNDENCFILFSGDGKFPELFRVAITSRDPINFNWAAAEGGRLFFVLNYSAIRHAVLQRLETL